MLSFWVCVVLFQSVVVVVLVLPFQIVDVVFLVSLTVSDCGWFC